MAERSPSLVCVGNLTIDEAIQPDGARSIAPGGDALFAALAARAHLDQVGWLAPIGTDFPADVLRDLDAAGLVAASPARRDLPTVRNVITYREGGTRVWDLVHGEAHFDAMSVYPDDVGTDVLAADGILVCGMSFRSQIVLTPWLRRQSRATIYLDVQEDTLAGNEVDWRLAIAACDVFLPSEVEAIALAGTSDLDRAMRMFRDLGPQTVVVKRAERGCLILSTGSDAIIDMATDPVVPVDSTGAGDAFCGAFAAVHLAAADAEEAARAGSAAARVAIDAPGILGLLRQIRTDDGRVSVG